MAKHRLSSLDPIVQACRVPLPLSPATDTKPEQSIRKYHPLLQNDLVAASPIFEEHSISFPLAAPHQSFRLRPREKTDAADMGSNNIMTATTTDLPEPVDREKLVSPKPSLPAVYCVWSQVSIATGRCIWTVEKQIEAWTGWIIDHLVQFV